MRISLVTVGPPYRGGLSDLSALIYSQLSKDHVVQFINYSRQYPKILFPGKTEFKAGGAGSDFPSERIVDSLNPFSWFAAAERIKKFEPDTVILRYWNPYFALMINLISKRLSRAGIKVAVFIDNLIPHEKSFIDSYMARRVLSQADHVFTMSKFVTEDVLSFKPDVSTTTMIHPLYENYEQKYSKSEARAILKLADQPVILFFGLIRPYKGLDILIRALEPLKEKLPDFRAFILGEAYENEQKYIDLIESTGVQSNVVYRNEFVPDHELPLYFAACDVLVLPYRTATQSGIIGVAFQMDRPVIATQVGGLGEYIHEGETGYLVDPDNPQELAATIVKFFTGNDRERMITTVQSSKSQFSMASFCTRMIESLNDD
ncbi:MAG: glycosyltransferase [Candidatus Marinimicrobia bacterium]|nr:glycosyltransferase [Candidatus Neomarinimicrobiota bacterium]